MSISSRVRSATGAISEINSDNLDRQKPRAIDAVEAVESEGSRIAGLARQAQGNDRTIQDNTSKIRTHLADITREKDAFFSSLAEIREELERAQDAFNTAMTNAQGVFDRALAVTQSDLNNDATQIDTANDSNRTLHDNIIEIAS